MRYFIKGKWYSSTGSNYQEQPTQAFSMMPQPTDATDVKQVIAEVAAQNELSKTKNSNND